MTDRGGDFLVVVAIDFGTTYSGYAYSLKNDYIRDPLRISVNTTWKNEGDGTYKTPTTILFNEDMQFDSFGYEAEKRYAELASSDESWDDDTSDERSIQDDEHKKWYYFRRFKMELYHRINRKHNTFEGLRQQRRAITDKLELYERNGKRMSALTVFSEAIKYFYRHFLRAFQERIGDEIKENQIKWVLTVPAIWSPSAKQFMRKAANKAGIPDELLDIALEPESAAVLCRYLALDNTTENLKDTVSAFGPGKSFLVVDCGGTVDVTAHRVSEDGSLEELYYATGGAAGGTDIDKAFFAYLENIFTKEVFQVFTKTNQSMFLELERNFEAKKRLIGEEKTKEITLSTVSDLIEIYHQNHAGQKISERLKNGDYEGVKISKGKMRFSSKVLEEKVFKNTIDTIVKHLKELFMNPNVSEIKNIILVGGFAESLLLRNAIKKVFNEKKVLHPPEPTLAVLKGAVVFGHCPIVSCRRSPMTYGLSTDVPFIKGKHKETHKHTVNGLIKCTDVFHVMVRKNETIEPEKTSFVKSFYPSDDKVARVELYQSSSESPEYTNDEECSFLGNIDIALSPIDKDEKREIKVGFYFGHTEIRVTAEDTLTTEKVSVNLNLLSRRGAFQET